MVDPTKASFDDMSLDTLIHPDHYVKKKEDSELPDFKNFTRKVPEFQNLKRKI